MVCTLRRVDEFVDQTRHTLIHRAGLGEADAWNDLTLIYRPFIRNWFQSHGLDQDADDLTQEVLLALLREMPSFQHTGQTGAFRKWLRVACVHRWQNHRRKSERQGPAVGGTNFLVGMANIEQSTDDLEAHFDRDHDQAMVRLLFDRVAGEFDAKSLEAFRQIVLAERPIAEVAASLQMSPGSIYVAKSRVLRRLREESQGLLELEE